MHSISSVCIDWRESAGARLKLGDSRDNHAERGWVGMERHSDNELSA
jgi:hypothetical protein